MNPSLTPEAAALLQEGITLVLSRWAALRMAVENEWGGSDSLQKSQQLGFHLFNRLTQCKEQVYIDDVEDMLDEFMLSLNTEIDDGSIEEIAEKVMIMHEECLGGNFDSIKALKETNVPSVSYQKQPGSDDDEDDDVDDNGDESSQEMEIDASNIDQNGKTSNTDTPKEAPPQVDDGWTVVSSRRSKGRRN